MKRKKAIAAMWALSLFSVLLVLTCRPFLPEQVPTHWNLDGSVTYSSPKQLWLIAGMGPALAALFQFLPHIDPRRHNYEKFQDLYDGFAVVIQVFLLTCLAITLSEAFRPGRIDVGQAVGLLIAILFLVIGNIMGKVKSNFFMGFRTPWALSDPDVWNRTQRLGGHVFFLSGLAALPLALFAPKTAFFAIFFLILVLGILFTYYMSWKWYRKKSTE